jgi:hypothetical protein
MAMHRKFSLARFGSFKQDPKHAKLIEQAVDAGGLMDPNVSRVLELAMKSGTASKGVQGKIAQYVADNQINPLAPFSTPQVQKLLGEVPFCKVLHNEVFVKLSPTDFFTHMFVAGATGSGKTQAILDIIYRCYTTSFLGTIIVFDSEKGELGKILAARISHVAIINNFADDVFIPPPGNCHDLESFLRYSQEYIALVKTAISNEIWSHVGEGALWQMIIDKAISQGYFSNGLFPTIKDITRILHSIPARNYSTRNNRKENMLDKLHLVASSFTRAASGLTLDLAKLKQHRVVVFDVSGLDSFKAAIVMLNILTTLYFANLKGADVHTPHPYFLIFDEAQPLLPKKANTMSGTPFLAQLLKKTRSARIGFLLAAQNPSLVHSEALANCAVTLSFRLSGEEVAFMGRVLGLNYQQQEYLRSGLQPGMALFAHGGRGIAPFPVGFRYFAPTFACESELSQAYQKGRDQYSKVTEIPGLVWEKVVASDPVSDTKQKTPDTDTKQEKNQTQMQKRARSVLAELCARPHLKIMELYESCGLASSTGKKVQQYLCDMQYVTLQTVSCGEKGKAFNCLEVTQKGAEFCETLGLTYTPIAGRGSFAHRLWQDFFAKYYRAKGLTVFIEGDGSPEDKADVTVVNKQGVRGAVEIELTSKNVVSNISRNLSLGYSYLQILVVSARVLTTVQKLIEAKFSLYRSHIAVNKISEFL